MPLSLSQDIPLESPADTGSTCPTAAGLSRQILSSHPCSVPRAQWPSCDDFSRIQPVSLPRTLGLGWAGLGWWDHLPSGLPVSMPNPWLRLQQQWEACVSRARQTPLCPQSACHSDSYRSKARAPQTGSWQRSCLIRGPAAPQECRRGNSGLRNIRFSFCPELSSPDTHWLFLRFSWGLVHVSSYPKGFP